MFAGKTWHNIKAPASASGPFGSNVIRMCLYIMAEVGEGDFWLSGIDSFERLAPKSGAMTEDEATRWANALHRASDDGVFFGASNYYTYIARRPKQQHL